MIIVREGDLTASDVNALSQQGQVACDIETTGLNWKTDSIGAVQLHSSSTGTIILRHFCERPQNLESLLVNPTVTKTLHHAIFDLRFIARRWTFVPEPCVCTKILAKLANPTGENSLKSLLRDLCEISIDKSRQRSDWLVDQLDPSQLEYASADVRYLLPLADRLEEIVKEKGLWHLAKSSFDFLPTKVRLDLGEFPDLFTY